MAPPKQYDEGGKLMDAERIEEEECFKFIDKLTLQGINSADVKKLQDTGIPLSPLLTPRPAPTSPPPLPKGALVRTCETMAPSKQYDEGEQLQLMDADRIEEEEEEEECFESIGQLISRGINSGDVKKLEDAGFYTCNGLRTRLSNYCSYGCDERVAGKYLVWRLKSCGSLRSNFLA